MLRTLEFASADCRHIQLALGALQSVESEFGSSFLQNALTCASISISVVTAFTGFPFCQFTLPQGRLRFQKIALWNPVSSFKFQGHQHTVVM